MITHRKTILLSGWITTAVLVVLATITPSLDSFGSTNNVLNFADTVHTILFSGLTMAGLHAVPTSRRALWMTTLISACVWFGARLFTILVSLVASANVTVLFFLVASAGAVVAFLTGTLANASTRPGATNVVTATHDLKNFRTLWVSIVVGTGLVILGMHLASYPVDSMRLSFSLIAQTIVRHFGPQAILTIMLLAIPLHIRLAHKVVVIPMAVFVLFEVLPTFTGFIGLSLNANSDLAPWLASRTSWLSTIAWIIAVVAIIVVFSRTDARRQASVDVRNPMDPVSNKH